MQVTDSGLCDTWYAALLARDAGYAGVFFVGVKTTGVFCLATCRARKPKRENVSFYRDFKAALSAGFRPCKICRPTENASSAPPMVEQVILIHRFTTPVGPMFVCASERGVCLLEFVDRRMLETEFRDIQRLLSARILAGENEHTRQAVKEIGEYFAGQRHRFSLMLDTPGSDFQLAVWQQLQAVPYGETQHYQGLAQQMGKSSAVRAVANANGANRVAIVIPCHRIIAKDGSLTGYGGGLARKAWLLAHEAKYR